MRCRPPRYTHTVYRRPRDMCIRDRRYPEVPRADVDFTRVTHISSHMLVDVLRVCMALHHASQMDTATDCYDVAGIASCYGAGIASNGTATSCEANGTGTCYCEYIADSRDWWIRDDLRIHWPGIHRFRAPIDRSHACSGDATRASEWDAFARRLGASAIRSHSRVYAC